MAASGLTRKTAVAMGGHETYNGLMRLVRPVSALRKVLGKVALLGIVGSVGADLLASSIRLAAQSQLQTRV